MANIDDIVFSGRANSVEFCALGFDDTRKLVWEAEKSVVLSLSVTGPQALSPITVDYITSDRTAVAGVDYVGETGTLTIEPPATAGEITVSLTSDDAAQEGYKEFCIVRSSPVNAMLDASMATVRILDDETAPAAAKRAWELYE